MVDFVVHLQILLRQRIEAVFSIVFWPFLTIIYIKSLHYVGLLRKYSVHIKVIARK